MRIICYVGPEPCSKVNFVVIILIQLIPQNAQITQVYQFANSKYFLSLWQIAFCQSKARPARLSAQRELIYRHKDHAGPFCARLISN